MKVLENPFVGTGGVIATALCCLGTPVILGIVAALGLGFLINDFILFPLLFFFLCIKVYSSYKNMLRHGNKKPFYLSIFGSLALFPSLFMGLIYGYSIVGIIFISAVWDVMLIRKWLKR